MHLYILNILRKEYIPLHHFDKVTDLTESKLSVVQVNG